MNSINNLYYIWLTQIKGVGPVIAKKLINIFKSPEIIYSLSFEDLLKVEGVGTELANKIIESRNLNGAETVLNNCDAKGIKITVIDDTIFPENIKECSDAPIVLYYKGTLYKKLGGVAIVGARRCTDYGKKVTVEAAEFLAKHDIVVISGMAKGIDSYAHTACLKADGFTAAVLGCSVDLCYPKEHSELMERIIENGVVISEYPPTTQPKPEHFPKRNKIISALSSKILVVEAGEKSGALITAEYAIRHKKELYAVPGDIYCKSFIGSNKLISGNAKIYLTPNQLLLDGSINRRFVEPKLNIRKQEDDSVEKSIVKLLRIDSLTIDEIALKIVIEKDKLAGILFTMELDSKIKAIGGKYQAITRREPK